MEKVLLLQSNKNERFDKEAFDVLGFALFFAGGTYGAKAIALGLGLGDFQEAASLCIYLVWFYLIGKMVIRYRNLFFKIIRTELIILLIFALNYMTFPDTNQYYTDYMMFLRQIFVVYIPAGVVGLCISNYENVFVYMRKTAWLGSAYMCISLILGYLKFIDYQYWGVHLSPLLLLSYGSFLSKKRISDFLLTVVDALLILLGGRQSLFAVAIGIVMMFFFMNEEKRDVRLLAIVSTILVILLIVLLHDIILDFLRIIIEENNIQSRTLNMLVDGKLVSTNTRDYIYQSAIKTIERNGIKVSGIFSDRYYIRKYGSWIAYPHNIILEYFIDFGIIGGSIISFVTVLLFAKNLVIGIKERRAFIGMLSSIVMFRLMVSSSYVIEGLFYTTVIILFGNNNNIKKNRYKNIRLKECNGKFYFV